MGKEKRVKEEEIEQLELDEEIEEKKKNTTNKKKEDIKKKTKKEEIKKKEIEKAEDKIEEDVEEEKIPKIKEKKKVKKTGLFIIGGVFIFLLVSLFCVYNFILLPKIDLKGKRVVVLNYKDKYVEKGYSASRLGSNLDDDVKVRGKVNEKKLGTYEITYEVGSGIFKRKVVRKVEVRDTTKPKLEVNDDDIYICPGADFVPDKVKATDNYDGDISKKVKSVINKDKTEVTYIVKDSSGNERKVTKKIIYKDKEGPEITLEGNEEMFVTVGSSFKDPGATAKDNCDGDVSKEIKVSGSVDTSKNGESTITYTVKDKAGNESKKTRKVHVTSGVIYLTFDDGPQDGTTNVILDILKEEGVKATFFVTNKGPDSLIKREYDEGHTVALHTASHDYALIYSSDEAYFNDLYSVQDRVKRITGYESKIMRFPGGASNTVSRKYSPGIMSRLTKEVVNRGFKYYDWNISSGDAGSTTQASGVYSNVVNSLNRNRPNMVLMHDIKPYTRDAIRDIIRYGKENGYTFERITMDTEMITQRVNN